MQMIVCPGCERPNGQAARFCLYCGYRFHAAAAAGTHEREAPRHADVREAQVCDHCAGPLHDRPGELRMRCEYCGTLYRMPGHGNSPVVIIQQGEPSPGVFESAPDANAVLGEVVDTLFNNGRRSRRGGDWELFRFGQNGCALALLFLPIRILARIFFREW